MIALTRIELPKEIETGVTSRRLPPTLRFGFERLIWHIGSTWAGSSWPTVLARRRLATWRVDLVHHITCADALVIYVKTAQWRRDLPAPSWDAGDENGFDTRRLPIDPVRGNVLATCVGLLLIRLGGARRAAAACQTSDGPLEHDTSRNQRGGDPPGPPSLGRPAR